MRRRHFLSLAAVELMRRPFVGIGRRGCGARPVPGGGGRFAKKPAALDDLLNWYRPEELVVGASASWADQGTDGSDLAAKGLDPINGIQIDGWDTMTGDGQRAFDGTATTISGARETWIVLRSNDHSTQLALDAETGTNRNTLFVDTGDDINANAGTTLDEITDGFREHRPEILRITADGVGNGVIYRCDTVANSIVALESGTIGSNDWGGITIGSHNNGGNPWKGSIAEVLRYDAALSDADAQTTAGYLLDKYPSARKRNWSTEELLCVGDSLTAGTPEQTHGRSYRSPLREVFEASDIDEGGTPRTIIFVGPTDDFCMDHAGVSGETVSQIDSRISAQITAAAPTVLVLIAGTNDCQDAGFNASTFNTDYTALLATIYAADNSLPVVLCLIPPLTNTTHNTNVNSANTELTKTGGVIENASSTITQVDLNSIITTGTHLGDGVHFNDTGAIVAADAIAAGIRAAIG